MPEVPQKKLSPRLIERTLWISLTAVLLLSILFLLLFSFPNIFRHKYRYVPPSAKTEKPSDYTSRMERVYHIILENYVNPVDPAELYRAAVQGMLGILDDPYAELMEKSSALDVRDTITGEFGGVGLVISKTKRPENVASTDESYALYVVSPLEGTPAYQAGVRAGDYIKKIDGNPTYDLTTEESMAMLRGKPGTSVTMTIQRGKIEFEINVKRAKIEIETAKYAAIDGYGYLRIIEFTNRLPVRVQEALTYFNEQKIKGLVIDLRGNPGGSLDSVLEVLDFLLQKDDVIVSTSSHSKQEDMIYLAKTDPIIDIKMPIIVLIDKGSASASEILAGALQSHHRAIIVGQPSYGKAQVQQIFPLKYDNTELFKLTVAEYFTPDGKNIDKEGIVPEILVNMDMLIDEKVVESWKILHEERLIEKFLTTTPNPTPQELERFVEEHQKKKGINLSKKDFLYLIRLEQMRRMTPAPVYDLDYDPALQKALEILKKKK